MVEACSPDRYSIPFVKESSTTKQILVRWGGRELLEPIRKLIDIQSVNEPIRIWGQYYPEHKAIIFDLTDVHISNRFGDDSSFVDSAKKADGNHFFAAIPTT